MFPSRSSFVGSLGHSDNPSDLIRDLTTATGGNMTDVAFLLGVRREWLYRRMHELEIFDEIQRLCRQLTLKRQRKIIEGETR